MIESKPTNGRVAYFGKMYFLFLYLLYCKNLQFFLCNFIWLSVQCLSFTDTCFTTTHLYTNMKANLSNVILIKQNG